MRDFNPGFRSGYFIFLISLLFNNMANAQPLNVNTGFTSPVSDLLEQIMLLTFRQAGLEINFTPHPAERSIALVALGIDDAECCRIPTAIQKDYPDLIQVPEVIYLAKFSAFAKKPVPRINSFEDLKPYTVASVAGWKILVNNISRIEPSVFHILDDTDSMFKVLQLERIDIATLDYLGGLEVISRLGLHDIAPIQPPLATAALYLYLNKHQAKLLPVLTSAIRELKKQGKIDQIISKFESPE